MGKRSGTPRCRTVLSKHGIALIMALIVGQTPAAETATLITQCEKLKRQTDRNICIAEVIRNASAAPAPAIAPAATPVPQVSEKNLAKSRAEPVFVAADALQSVIGLGVSYNDYNPYVQTYAIALGQYKAALKSAEEHEAATSLDAALEGFKDAREYWMRDIEFTSKRENRFYFAMPPELANTVDIVNRYSIPLRKADIFGVWQGATRADALKSIWSYAHEKIGSARSTLESIGAPPPVVAADPHFVSDQVETIARAGLVGAGCDPIGKLRVWKRPNQQDVITSECSGGERQSVSCGPATCSHFEQPEYSEKIWSSLK